MSKTKLVFEVCVKQDKNSAEHFVSSVIFDEYVIQDDNYVEHFVSSAMHCLKEMGILLVQQKSLPKIHAAYTVAGRKHNL